MNRFASSFLISVAAHLILLSAIYLLIPEQAGEEINPTVSVDLLKVNPKRIPRKILGRREIHPQPEIKFSLNRIRFKPEVKPTVNYAESAWWISDMDTDYQFVDVDVPSNLPPGKAREIKLIKESSIRYPVFQSVKLPDAPAKKLPGLPSFLKDTSPLDQEISVRLPVKSLTEFLEKVRKRIERNKFYPLQARRMGYEGTVIISFEVLEDGRVGDIKVLKSSGYDVLDKAGIEAIRRSSPFPKLSLYTFKRELWIKVPITFKLSEVRKEG